MSKLVLEGECYYNFINSLRSEDTKTDYRNALIRFARHFSITDISILSAKDIESRLKEYIVYLKEQGRSRSSMNIITAAKVRDSVKEDPRYKAHIKKVEKQSKVRV
jgi:hypothetical protein